MSFLPAAPRQAALPVLAGAPPLVQSNLHLSQVPKVLTANPQFPPRPTRSDALMQKAEERFRRGRKYYQLKDAERARVEFDSAIDLMLDGSENPSDRQAFESKLEKMVDAIHRYDLAGLGSAVSVDELAFEKAPLEDILDLTFTVDPKLKIKVKEEVQATVSQLPLEVNDSVLGYIHYFSGTGRKTILAGLQRAGRYRALVQRILDEEGLPQELIYLAQAESGFLPRAVSRKAAAGMWQFVRDRGREYGLKQTAYTDDRLDPEKATRAAARHLRDLFDRYGDWYLAIAAYNCGPGAVDRAVERTGYADFWELRSRRVLPAETTNYVPIILAITIMVKNPAEYDLDNVTAEPALDYDAIEIESPTHLALVGDLTETPVSELLALNPALLKGVAPEGYSLRVPKGSANLLMAVLQTIPPARRASWRMHRVESGDTLASIGRRYGAAPDTIAAANRMESDDPIAGDLLVIPASYHAPKQVGGQTGASTHSARRTASRQTHARSGSANAHSSMAAPAPKKPAVLTRTAANLLRGTKQKRAMNR